MCFLKNKFGLKSYWTTLHKFQDLKVLLLLSTLWTVWNSRSTVVLLALLKLQERRRRRAMAAGSQQRTGTRRRTSVALPGSMLWDRPRHWRGQWFSEDFLSFKSRLTAENNLCPLIWRCNCSWFLCSLHYNWGKSRDKMQKHLLTLNFGNGLRSVSGGLMLLLLSRRAPTYILMLLMWLPHGDARTSVSISEPRLQDASPPPLLILLLHINTHPSSHPLWEKKEGLVLVSSCCLSRSSAVHQEVSDTQTTLI